jgi:DUF1707 SHOCT-like domain
MTQPYDRSGAGGSSPPEPTRPPWFPAGPEPYGPRVPPRLQWPQGQFWIWPGAGVELSKPAPTGPVRIGDAERDRAIASLGDHFAAGRLNQQEFDERVDVAMKARFEQDLEPLFADLPKPEPVPYGPYGVPGAGPRRPVWAAMSWILPLLVVATVVTAVVAGTPWILWGLFWIFLASGFWGRRRYYGYRYYGYRHPGYRQPPGHR